MTRFSVPLGLLALTLTFPLSCRSATAAAAPPTFVADGPNPIAFPTQTAKFVRRRDLGLQRRPPCIDELEIYGSDSKKNLALASGGAKATASSCLPGHAIHQVAHLNDGLYGKRHSWIAASEGHGMGPD